jgi:gliding motility-associated-like protein
MATVGQVVLERTLIGSGSTEFSGSSFELSASVGEPMVTTFSNGIILTQGFQQSNYIMSEPYVLTLTTTSAACLGANDGTVTIDFISDNIPEPLTYQWNNGSTAASIAYAVAGTYTLTVTGGDQSMVVASATVDVELDEDCTPGFYIGITPNGDGSNDYWHVDNIYLYQNKSVEIFNRYGALVWDANDYDNENSDLRFNGQHRNGNDLPDGTYYYVVKLDASVFRGWIEISR